MTVVPVVMRMEKSRNLVEGDTLELDCISWGWPSPNITWRRLDPSSGAESNLTTASTSVVVDVAAESSGRRVAVRLSIEHVALSDYSSYVCVAANAVGSNNATVLVRVKGRPHAHLHFTAHL